MRRIALLPVVIYLGLFVADSLMAATPLTTLHIFHDTDGNAPVGALVLGTNGNFYGVTSYGGTGTNCGSGGCGTVFEISAGGAFTSLHSFTNYDGEAPRGGLAQGSDGNFYGTTYFGAKSTNCVGGCGTVFKITLNGVLTTLHSFDGSDGSWPLDGLVEGSDGNFYGTTGGVTGQSCSNGCGTV